MDPVPYYVHYGQNAWAGVKAHLDEVTERAAAPVVAKYTGVLAAADIEVFTTHHHLRHHAVPAPRQRPQRTPPPLTTQATHPGPARRPRDSSLNSSRPRVPSRFAVTV